jgi:hypothetical protein
VRDEALNANGEAEIAFYVVTGWGFADRDVHRARLEHAERAAIGEAIKVKAGKTVSFKGAPKRKASVLGRATGRWKWPARLAGRPHLD